MIDTGNELDQLKAAFCNKEPFLIFAEPDSHVIKAVANPKVERGVYITGAETVFIFAPFDTKTKAYSASLSGLFSFQPDCGKTTLEPVKLSESDRPGHLSRLEYCIKQIEQGRVDKVVISRSQQIRLKGFDLVELISLLICSDNSTFRYLWYHPETGIWAGSTPETLAEVNGREFATMSLAGTRRASSTGDWSKKEFEEQAYVTHYLSERLAPFLKAIEIKGPYDQLAGDLVHLRSDISGVLSDFDQLPEVLDSIHPTPAVCGTPLEPSKELIEKLENYNRLFYTGYLGLVNRQEQSASLYVNLRCMSIEHDVATIYTGGGITAASVPSEEWIETCLKQRSMLKVLTPFL